MAKNETCYLCGQRDSVIVAPKVRDRDDVAVLKCRGCGLVFLDSFDHITADYYSADYTDSHHGAETWQAFLARCSADDTRRASQLAALVTNKRYLDIGCGAGGVLLKLRALATAVTGVEPQCRWRGELEREGIPVHERIDDAARERVDVASAFHVLEHVADPRSFLQTVKSCVVDGGSVILEVPSADDALMNLFDSSAFAQSTYWSAHLFLYTPSTLRTLLGEAGLHVDAIEQFQRYPLSNHLHWLAKGAPGGHAKWAFLDSDVLGRAYADTLGRLGMCDTLIAYARRP
jgi:cyclopropane fatty-acyl-phospholipid synthase-like methyltransferase